MICISRHIGAVRNEIRAPAGICRLRTLQIIRPVASDTAENGRPSVFLLEIGRVAAVLHDKRQCFAPSLLQSLLLFGGKGIPVKARCDAERCGIIEIFRIPDGIVFRKCGKQREIFPRIQLLRKGRGRSSVRGGNRLHALRIQRPDRDAVLKAVHQRIILAAPCFDAQQDRIE